MEQAELLIYKENGINNEFMIEWLEMYSNDEVIQSYTQRLEDLNKMVFENHRIDHIQCEKLPKGLDGETYILIFRKQQACLRHHYWQVFDRTGGLSEDPEI